MRAIILLVLCLGLQASATCLKDKNNATINEAVDVIDYTSCSLEELALMDKALTSYLSVSAKPAAKALSSAQRANLTQVKSSLALIRTERFSRAIEVE